MRSSRRDTQSKKLVSQSNDAKVNFVLLLSQSCICVLFLVLPNSLAASLLARHVYGLRKGSYSFDGWRCEIFGQFGLNLFAQL